MEALAWSWSAAARGAVYALPAALVMPSDSSRGLALAVGVLPAAVLGMPARRAQRGRIVVLGVLAAVPLLLGSVLGQVPVVAVAALFALCVAASTLAADSPIGRLALTLCLPMIGIGFSYDDVAETAGLALLIVGGSVWAYLVALAWPDTVEPQAARAPRLSRRQMAAYGVRLGAAASMAAAIGFALDLDHVGWATAAVLLVMRPSVQAQHTRMVGRIASVVVGALVAVLLVAADPTNAAVGAAVLVALAAASATHGSRWYVAPAFTTFVVFMLMLASAPEDSVERFGERVGETLLGVGLAFAFGVVVPWVFTGAPESSSTPTREQAHARRQDS